MSPGSRNGKRILVVFQNSQLCADLITLLNEEKFRNNMPNNKTTDIICFRIFRSRDPLDLQTNIMLSANLDNFDS